MKDKNNLEKLKYPIGIFQKPENITDDLINNWKKIIQNFPIELEKTVEKLDLEKLNWIYRPNGWSIKQVIHHCADSHINAFVRFKLALTEENPIIKPYEEAKWANLPDGNADDISSSISILKGVHHRWNLILNYMSKTDFERNYFHPATQKNFTLADALGLYVWHCNHHLAHINQALKFENKF
jgi:hypothetical protein